MTDEREATLPPPEAPQTDYSIPGHVPDPHGPPPPAPAYTPPGYNPPGPPHPPGGPGGYPGPTVPYGGGYQAAPVYSGKAITSFVLSLVGLLFMWIPPFGLAAIPGVILGHIAQVQLRRQPGLRGAGLALAGVIIGYAAIVIGLALIALFIVAGIIGAGAGDLDCTGNSCRYGDPV